MDAIAVDLDKTTAGPFLAIRVVVVSNAAQSKCISHNLHNRRDTKTNVSMYDRVIYIVENIN